MLVNKMATNRHATSFINHNMFICIFVSLLLPMANEGAANVYGDSRSFPNDDGGKRLTREYHLRQGALRGLIVKPSRQYDFQYVEMFLGIPYAAPPTGHLRFMPPVSAPPWRDVKMATRFAPVCPQSLPPIKKGNPPSSGRQHYMNQLKTFLTNESEDCLYLNIYVPYREQKTKKFPVLVFIHGDSFEWSSGNPYDGRVLASYGSVMVITVNFRLGILGFMKPSLTEHVYGNNGLLDQLAALQWIKDNIEDLNGDPSSVTLMGHGTGAACVNFLMLSPISNEQKTKKFPVLVFIHGDSFEWSSGNPYDGRVLASYGSVMVITVNFRLGILGFMKPSLTEHVYGNNGLLDQLAALQWIKDNIEDLNGDPSSVTLMGHGTGAACVNFLMLSPISNGLFHRAILMSGSALSDWAMTKDPTPYTLQVAQSLGCNPNSKNMMTCLQKKPLSEIKKVQILAREFETPLGPVVAGSFIPNEPAKTMESYPNLLSKYQLLSGVTEMERYHDFGVIELEHGVLENQRDDFIKKYAKIIFEGAEDQTLKSILKEYSPSKLDPQRWNVETNRDVILNVFSDARTLAPVIRFANYQSKANRQSYFYVFGHNSISSDYAALNKSVQGQELPYVFGVPLGATNTHFDKEYTQHEKLLSEVLMRMWTNFVKYGSPNSQAPVKFYNLDRRQWSLYDLDWPEYDGTRQSYLRFDIPPEVDKSYRANYTKFWTETLPSKMSKYVIDPLFEYTPPPTRPPPTTKPKITHRNTANVVDPVRRIWAPQVAETPHYSSSIYGKMRPYSQPVRRPDTNVIYKEIMSIEKPARPVPSGLMENTVIYTTTTKPKPNLPVKTSSATITLIVSLAILFLAVNVGICSILYFKKRKLRLREQTLESSHQPRAEIGEVNVIGQKSSKDDKSALQTLKNGCSVIKSMSFNKMKNNSKKHKKKSDPCKTPKSDDSGGFRERFKLRRHLSTSTLDAHTKVRDWIANEMMHRCSPGILRKSNSDLNEKHMTVAKPFTRSEELLSETKKSKTDSRKMNDSINSKSFASKTNSKARTSEKTTSTSALGSHSSIGSHKQSLSSIKQTSKSNDSIKSKATESIQSKKVSVAIDATPAARTNSILNQEPIEISKSFDAGDQIHSNKLEKSTDSELKTPSNTEPNKDEKTFTNVVTLAVQDKPLIISHKHSSSDPVTDVNYDKLLERMECNNLANILPPVTFRNDVNVTSREERSQANPMTAEEALLTIKKRNFPKVLPDLPKAQKRLSLQPNSLQTFRGYSSMDDRPKVPPQPPPRTTTLERRLAYKNTKPLSSFDASQVKKINENVAVKNYENIDSLSPYPAASRNASFDRSKPETTIVMAKDREFPRVIIASSDIPSSQEPKIVITPSPSQVEIPTNVPRVRLPDDFHIQTGSVTSFSSFCSDEDDDDDDIDLDEEFEDKLIQELVGGVDSPTNMDDILDTKGPDTIYEKKLEIVPVKINPGNVVPRPKDDYVCVSDLFLPDVSDLEKTAQIKPNFGLNKLQHRTESIHRPPEKAVKVKQRKSIRTPSILSRSSKGKRGSDKRCDSVKLEHSNSGSSNDTETSTGTVKKVEFKKG
uniref:Carboxylesterase type B domain-containing protein n=1 Tax=Heliothis virescens TaxID=7102 RepID=A0A2A4J5D4_HELVI